MKKLLSMLLAGVMVLALAVPALADNQYQTVTNNTLTLASEALVPTMKVELPNVGSSAFALNPYKLSYTTNFTFTGAAADTTVQSNQIVSPIYYIRSATNTPLKVGVTATTKLAGHMTALASKALAATEKSNTAFVKVYFLKSDNESVQRSALLASTSVLTLAGSTKGTAASLAATAQPTIDAGAYSAAVETVYKKDANGNTLYYADIAPDTDTGATEHTKDTDLGHAVTNPDDAYKGADNSGEPEKIIETAGSGESFTYKYLAFTFDGTMTTAPTTPWDSTDKITVTMVFTFSPAEVPAAPAQTGD